MTMLSCISLISPVGNSAASTAAALRAGISALSELPYHDRGSQPIVGASVGAVPLGLRGRDRLAALARLLVEQLDHDLDDRLPWSEMPLILCTRELERAGPSLKGIVGDLSFPNGARVGGKQGSHIAAGPTSAFMAIEQAQRILRERRGDACLIMAVDSLIDARSLNWLAQHGRLKTSEETDGNIPGEAACLMVVSNEPVTPSHLTIRGLGLASETATVLNEEPFRAEGLTTALKAALQEAAIEMHDVAFRLSDVAGESYAFEELLLAQLRLMRKTRAEQPVWHAADCIGDCGAAAGPIQFAWAEQAFARRYAPGPIAALHGSSSLGGRAAAVVTA